MIFHRKPMVSMAKYLIEKLFCLMTVEDMKIIIKQQPTDSYRMIETDPTMEVP